MEAGAPDLAAVLQDDVLRGIQETGMYNIAAELGLIPEGDGRDTKLQGRGSLHESPRAAYTPRYDCATPMSDSDMVAVKSGQQLVIAADAAISQALRAGEAAGQHLAEGTAAATSDDGDDPMLTTPPKQRKKRSATRGMNSGGSDGVSIGGRNNGKGLRHFSMKVCEKVESKGRTTYNEVADELVSEFSAPNAMGSPGGAAYDEKNIRRRVYDALNVLMAMDIITKDKKEISWQGLPTAPASQLERLKQERSRLRARVAQQQAYLKETSKQHAAYRNLIQRHLDRPASLLAKAEAASRGSGSVPTALPLPFILIQVNPEASVEIQIAEDSRQAMFDFAGTCFRIMGDDEVLYEMNLHLNPQGKALDEPPQPQQQRAAEHSTPVLPAVDVKPTISPAAMLDARHSAVLSSAASGGAGPLQHDQHMTAAPLATTRQHSQAMAQLSSMPRLNWPKQEQQVLSPSSAKSMEEGTPPDTVKSAGGRNGRIPQTPPSGGSLTAGAMDLSPGGLLPVNTMSSSQASLMSPPAEMVNAQSAQAWGRWPEAQDSANLSHVSVSTPTAPSAQHLMQAMHQMHATGGPGFGGPGFSQAFPIPTVDSSGHPHVNHWHM